VVIQYPETLVEQVMLTKFLGLLADTVSAPSFTWSGDLTTGIYHPTTSQIAISIAGTQRGLWSSSGLIVTGPLVQQVLVELGYGIDRYCTKFNRRLLTHSSGELMVLYIL
jgi:hypothetical protein